MKKEIKEKLVQLSRNYLSGISSEDDWLDLINFTNDFHKYCRTNNVSLDSQDEFELKCIIQNISDYNEVFRDEPSEIN